MGLLRRSLHSSRKSGDSLHRNVAEKFQGQVQSVRTSPTGANLWEPLAKVVDITRDYLAQAGWDFDSDERTIGVGCGHRRWVELSLRRQSRRFFRGGGQHFFAERERARRNVPPIVELILPVRRRRPS